MKYRETELQSWFILNLREAVKRIKKNHRHISICSVLKRSCYRRKLQRDQRARYRRQQQPLHLNTGSNGDHRPHRMCALTPKGTA